MFVIALRDNLSEPTFVCDYCAEPIDYGAGDPDVLQMTLRVQRSALIRQMFDIVGQCYHLTQAIGDNFEEAVHAECDRQKAEGAS